MQSDLKTCLQCGEAKPFSDFGKCSPRKDGFNNHCKACRNAYLEKYRDTPSGRESSRRALAKYRQSEKGKESKRRRNRSTQAKEYAKRWWKSERGISLNRRRAKQYLSMSPQKCRARTAIGVMVFKGKIPPARDLACAHCGLPAAQYHHHNGYDEASKLDVIPLCVPCHKAADKQQQEVA